jgi:hypothetical protein
MVETMKSRARMTVFLAAMLAVAALGTGVASAAAGGTDRPLKSSGTLTGSSDISGNYDITGVAVQSHLGRSSIEVVGNYVVGQSVVTVTAANGDTYVSELVSANPNPSNVCPAIANTLFGNLPYDVGEAITGGTGRFSGASGSIHTTGCFAVDQTTLNLTVTFVDDGIISY